MKAPCTQACSSEQGAAADDGRKEVRFRAQVQRQFKGKGTEGASEYQDRYRWFTFQDHTYSGRFKPKPMPVHKDKEKMQLQTSYERNYVEHQIKMRMKPKPKPYCPPEGKMKAKTVYQDTFTKKEAADSVPYAPSLPFRVPAKRTDIVSEYQTAFIPLESPRTKPCKMKEAMELPTGKMNEVSTIQRDYKEHKDFKRVLPIYQGSRQVAGKGPFPNTTTYRETYTLKGKEYKKPKCWKMTKPCGQDGPHFTDVVEAEEGPPRPASLPDYKPAKLKPLMIFEGQSTQQSDYKSWPVKPRRKPFWVKEMEFKLPPGGTLMTTTYELDFSKKTNVPIMISRNKKKPVCVEEVENTVSSYPDTIHNTHFTGQYGPPARSKPPVSDKWHASTCGNVPLCTTYMASYVGESGEQRRIRRLNMKNAMKAGGLEQKSLSWNWAPYAN